MKKYIFTLLATSLLIQPAMAQNLVSQNLVNEISVVMHSSSENSQIVAEAQEDASEFTFSDGMIRGEDFDRALATIRKERPRLRASDMELAIAMLQAN